MEKLYVVEIDGIGLFSKPEPEEEAIKSWEEAHARFSNNRISIWDKDLETKYVRELYCTDGNETVVRLVSVTQKYPKQNYNH